MMDLLGTLQAIVKPHGEDLLETEWLDTLPRGDYLAAQDAIIAHLRQFTVDGSAEDVRRLHALFQIDERCRENVAALTRQYIGAPTLSYEIDERLWHAVYDYYQALERAYQELLDRHSAHLSRSPIASESPQLLLNLVDCLRCSAKWRYLRYRSMAEGGWLRLHELYRLGERLGCTKTLLRRYPDTPPTTLTSCYLQALMLDTLNHTSMLKSEIEMLAQWLSVWCEPLTLETDYNVSRHLFFVALDEDRGGRRIRHFQPKPSYRYWDTDKTMLQVERLNQYVRQRVMPVGLALQPNVSFADCQLLIDQMMVEWSRTFYLRQRRSDERNPVSKMAQVVNGILHVCQHVKNVQSRPALQHEAPSGREGTSAVPGSEAGKTTDSEIVLTGTAGEKWNIRNESRYGFGAVVDADLNLWLRPGRIIAINYELNPDMPVVGVVRSVKQLPGNRRHVGIEVLSHTPAYVRLRSLNEGNRPRVFLAPDAFLTSTLTLQGQPAFAGLYLPRDEEKSTPSTLLMPRAEFIADGIFELRTEHHHRQVRLGRVLEQKDDWVRVEMQVPELDE